jgi:hypothetical protein
MGTSRSRRARRGTASRAKAPRACKAALTRREWGRGIVAARAEAALRRGHVVQGQGPSCRERAEAGPRHGRGRPRRGGARRRGYGLRPRAHAWRRAVWGGHAAAGTGRGRGAGVAGGGGRVGEPWASRAPGGEGRGRARHGGERRATARHGAESRPGDGVGELVGAGDEVGARRGAGVAGRAGKGGRERHGRRGGCKAQNLYQENK